MIETPNIFLSPVRLVLHQYVAIQQRNHMRLTARVGQVERLLRRICPVDRSPDDAARSMEAFLKIAVEELSSCLNDDMGSCMRDMTSWNPLSESGLVFRPEFLSHQGFGSLEQSELLQPQQEKGGDESGGSTQVELLRGKRCRDESTAAMAASGEERFPISLKRKYGGAALS